MSSRPIAIHWHEGRQREPPAWISSVDATTAAVGAPILPEPTRAAAREAPCALLDGVAPAAISMACQLQVVDPALQLAIVAPRTEHARLRRSLMSHPGLGDVWVVTPEEVASGLVERARRLTHQRRNHEAGGQREGSNASGIRSGGGDGAEGPRRPAAPAARTPSGPLPVISRTYLEALSDVLPDPVLSVDENGRIVSLSAAAERILGDGAESLGADVAQVLVPDDAEAFEALLRSGLPARRELGFQRKDGDHRIGAMVVIPVEVDHPVRVLFIRDLTEERRARLEVETQATELDRQADELQTHAAQFQDSQRELESANEQLLRANEELAARTAEADRARQIAEENRHEAETANRAKSEFLATMSHEIRTPINAIIGYTDLLDMGIGGAVTEDQKKKLHRIRSSSRHLLALVDDVLDLAKVEAGRMSVEPGRAAAADAVAAALALVRPLAARRGIEIVEESEENRPSYVGDEDRVRQVLVNLLSNAIKFSDGGGRICVSYAVQGPDREDVRWTLVRVADSGIGVAPEALERIFRAFEQVEHGHTRTRGGTGLGLTISRKLARLMGGDLTVESEPGRGSTFTLWLPSQATILGPIDETVLAEMLGPGALPPGLAAAGTVLQDRVRSILDVLAHRIRHDPRIPMADALGEADVEDHSMSFLADLGNNLIALEKAKSRPERLLHDGGEIQRVIAELHGSQRAQLGWTEDALVRELEIQQDEIRKAVIDGAPEGTDVEGVLQVLGRFLERTERITLISWRRASATPGGDLSRGTRSRPPHPP